MGYESKEHSIELRDARGGIVRRLLPHLIFDNQVVQLQNAYTHLGGLRKTSGHSAALTTVPLATMGLAVCRAYDLVSGNFTVMHFANGKIYYLSGARATCIGSNLSKTAKACFAQVGRKLYYDTGSSNTWGWSGVRSRAVFLGAAGITRLLFYHQDSNRLFWGRSGLAGSYQPQRVYFSDINVFETQPSNNWLDIPESRTGDKVMGFERLLGNLVIFGERTVSVLYGRTPADYRLS